MRKSKFTPEQILQSLRHAESGTTVVDICRKLGVTETTFYRRKKQYRGLSRRHISPSEIRLVGKESNALELVEAGLLGDWSAIQSEYGTGGRPSAEVLHAQPATAIARACNVSVRTVRSWRRSLRTRAQHSGD